MDEELDYLWETLGLEITADLWPERDKIHPTLRPAITVMQAKYRRASFLIMRMSWHAGLPDLKRSRQASSSCPVCRLSYPRRTWSSDSASDCNSSGFPLSARCSGISALYGRGVLERQAQQARKGLQSARMGTARGLSRASPPMENTSHPEHSKRVALSAAATATPRPKPIP